MSEKVHISVVHLQIIYLLNLQCNVSLTRGPLAIAEPLVVYHAISLWTRACSDTSDSVCHSLASTPSRMPGTHPHQYFGWWGRQWEYPHQTFYVLSDIADQH